MKRYLAVALTFSGAAMAARATPAGAALVLGLKQVTPGPVTAGTVVPIRVLLQGSRTAEIDLVQFDLSAPPGGSSFSTSTVADGFDESALSGLLSLPLDGSLVNDRTLSFATLYGSSDTGIPAGSADVEIGTFYLQTPVGGGSYALTFTSTEVTDSAYNPVAITPAGLTVVATVPEPAGLATAFGLATGLLRRRGRSGRNSR